MSEYTLALNAHQDFALAYETERRAMLGTSTPAPGLPVPVPLTPEEVLQGLVTDQLAALYGQVQGVVDPLVEVARSLPLPARAALLASLPRTSLVAYLTWRLQQEGA